MELPPFSLCSKVQLMWGKWHHMFGVVDKQVTHGIMILLVQNP